MVPSRLQRASVTQYRYLRSLYKGKHLSPPHRLRWYLIALVLGIYVVHLLNGDRGVFRRAALSRELKEVTAANARLRLQKERLIQEVLLKQDDPMSLERLARSASEMVRRRMPRMCRNRFSVIPFNSSQWLSRNRA